MCFKLSRVGLLNCCSEWASQCSAGSSHWWWQWGKAGRLTNPATSQGLEPELWVGPPQYPPHLWTAGECEVVGPAGLKLQNLHDARQQQDIQEESQWRPSHEGAEEARGPWTRPMTHCKEHLKVKMYGPKGTVCDSLCHTTDPPMRLLLVWSVLGFLFVCFCLKIYLIWGWGGRLQGRRMGYEGMGRWTGSRWMMWNLQRIYNFF